MHPGITLATGRGDKSDAFYSKRVPKGAPSYVETTRVTFPSGRTAHEVCVANLATVAWCAQMGTVTFHPWPTRSADNDHPDELRIDLDPQPGTTFTDAVRVADVARELLEELGITGYPKTSGNRGVHVYVRIEPRWDFVDVRHAAIGFGRELEKRDPGVTTRWWKEERGERIFVDFNQNCRDRTIASAYSLRPLPGAPVSTPVTWREFAGLTDPRVFNLFTVPERLTDGDPWAGIDETAHSIEPGCSGSTRSPARARPTIRRTTPRCPVSRPGCSRRRRWRRTGTSRGSGSRTDLGRTRGFGSDHNNGYECDGNGGVGQTNPAHTVATRSPDTLTPSAPGSRVRGAHCRRWATACQAGSCISCTVALPWSQERATSLTVGSTSALEST